MKTTSSSSPYAYLATGRDKNRLKIYGTNNVYLQGGQEFQIELFNPTQETVGAKIFINGNPISNRMLVLKPGEREWLQRHIDTDAKFVFNTYTVENSNEAKSAIANNGTIRIEFYKEAKSPVVFFPTSGTVYVGGIYNYPNWQYINHQPYNPSYTNPTSGNNVMYSASMYSQEQPSLARNIVGTNQNGNIFKSATSSASIKTEPSKSIETGRVEQGAASGQSFGSYSGTFDTTTCAVTSFNILPVSTQPVEAGSLREYCSECGIRIRKSSWKFCANCGTKLE